MKRIIFTIITVLVLLSLLSVSALATEENTEMTEESTELTEENTEITEELTDKMEENVENKESAEEFDFEEYLTERIAPVCVGVATSLIALIGTISKVKASVTSIASSEQVIKEVKEITGNTLSSIKEELYNGLKEMESHVCQIDEVKEGYYELKERYEELVKKNKDLMESIKLGFESIPDVVQSGAARKIAIISEESVNGEE